MTETERIFGSWAQRDRERAALSAAELTEAAEQERHDACGLEMAYSGQRGFYCLRCDR